MTTVSTKKLDLLNEASKKTIKNSKTKGLAAIKRADEAPRSPEEVTLSPVGRPPGASSRARGMLDKSSYERVKNRFDDFWMR